MCPLWPLHSTYSVEHKLAGRVGDAGGSARGREVHLGGEVRGLDGHGGGRPGGSGHGGESVEGEG